jgi:hypothetical protein
MGSKKRIDTKPNPIQVNLEQTKRRTKLEEADMTTAPRMFFGSVDPNLFFAWSVFQTPGLQRTLESSTSIREVVSSIPIPTCTFHGHSVFQHCFAAGVNTFVKNRFCVFLLALKSFSTETMSSCELGVFFRRKQD